MRVFTCGWGHTPGNRRASALRLGRPLWEGMVKPEVIWGRPLTQVKSQAAPTTESPKQQPLSLLVHASGRPLPRLGWLRSMPSKITEDLRRSDRTAKNWQVFVLTTHYTLHRTYCVLQASIARASWNASLSTTLMPNLRTLEITHYFAI